MRKRLLQVLLPVLGVAVLLFAVAAVGRATREWLRQQERTTFAFADIDCEPPPGMERDIFLDEVQYEASLPARLRLLDEDLASRLTEAFGRHPWVEKVRQVDVIPPRQVRVRLAYRTPVLAVPQGGRLRAVDRHGILLPASAPTEGLPVYRGTVRPPGGEAGTPWGDRAVEEAARTAAETPPH